MYEIPKPQLLDPDRVDRDDREDLTLEDHRSQAQLLAKALGESCAYADQLWEQVNALRGYLLDSLPPDPRKPGPHMTASASPTGPDDEQGWLNWINAFATTTSVLCGSHGNSGFGVSRAREEAQIRRTAPELRLHARHPELGHTTTPPSVATADATAEPTPSARSVEAGAPSNSPANSGIVTIAKGAAAGVVAVLALRGLRAPRRHTDTRTPA